MLRQTDKDLNWIGPVGCYILSIFAMAEAVTGVAKSAKDVFLAIADAWREGWINDQHAIVNAEAIADATGVDFTYLGKMPATYICGPGEKEILEFFNVATGVTHFVLGDGKGGVAFDPYENSRTVREGKIVSKRPFKVVKIS